MTEISEFELKCPVKLSRRVVLAGGVAAFVCPSVALAASQVRVWGLWLEHPSPLSNGLDRLRGTLHFRTGRDRSDRTLNAYGSGANWRDTTRQCTELIKRYGYEMRLPRFSGSNLNDRDFYSGSPALGNAHQVAGRFATASNGAFIFSSNSARTLPNPGSVLSIAPWTGNAFGHVGITCNYSSRDVRNGEVRIKLFDQNLSANSWGEVRFLLSGRGSNARWSGSFRSANGRAYYPVSGWASPAS
jgi:hypothetical protein